MPLGLCITKCERSQYYYPGGRVSRVRLTVWPVRVIVSGKWWYERRSPVPDHYSLTMELSRNRTTAAREIVCDSDDNSSSCPPRYLDGRVYVQRSVNEPCHINSTVSIERLQIVVVSR